jgi:UDP-N-acetylglucosamine--dolichyl-phosphate N-acetylglucosaminephosphotransferase
MVVSSDRVFLLPLIGFVRAGLIYPLLLVPIGVMAAANLTNMLAGFNGLEAGMGLIAISCLTISGCIIGNVTGVIVLAPMIGSLLAFLIYNRYPARIFPGNSGTYAIGAVIAAGVIIGDMEVVGIICLAPYIVEFVVKAMGGFKGSCLGNRNRDNTLSPPKSGPESLTHFVMGRGRFTESQLVRLFLLIEMIFGIIAIIIAYSSLYFMLFPAWEI